MARSAVAIFEVCGLLQKSRMSTQLLDLIDTVCRVSARSMLRRPCPGHPFVGGHMEGSSGVCTIPGFHTWTCQVAAHNTASRATRPPCLLDPTTSSSSVCLVSSSVCVSFGVAAAAAKGVRGAGGIGCHCERRLQGYLLVILKQGLACLAPSRPCLAERPKDLLALWLGLLACPLGYC